MTQPIEPWIPTHSGRMFRFDEPDPACINLNDVAHALSHICRFGGSTSRFYSVAEHCVHVSRLVPREHALWGLLHDAGEAYVGDMVTPLKRHLGRHPWHVRLLARLVPGLRPALDGYGELSRKVERAVAARFGLPWPEPECVKQADLAMLAAERDQLLADTPFPWDIPEPAAPVEIACWTPIQARFHFLLEHKRITRALA